MNINAITFLLHICVYRESVRYFESKERRSEACVLCHSVHHLQSYIFAADLLQDYYFYISFLQAVIKTVISSPLRNT
jgi:hypothetical protein